MKRILGRLGFNAFWIAFVIQACFCGQAFAKKVEEHPLIRPFPGSVLAKNISKNQKFYQAEFYYMDAQTKRRKSKKVKGKYYFLLYEVRKPDGKRVRDISSLEFIENYKSAAIEKGGKIIYEDNGQVVFTLPGKDGGITWCKMAPTANLGQQYLTIIDEKGFKKSLTFGPKEMKAALDKDGKVSLYGILFDLDKASLKPESVKQLQHVLSLMTTYPKLNLEIQGHTDDQGSDSYNLELSQKRAETVCVYLGLFGIQPQRLKAVGYGETKPVAPNTTREGRAKNRRVELVKLNTSAGQAAPAGQAAAASAKGKLQGKWIMTPNKTIKKGAITFQGNGAYLMEETLPKGQKVSRKGEFKANFSASPARMELCLQKCGAPGSRHTTSFAIFRFLPGDKLEIKSSPDGRYPPGFDAKPGDRYTMILQRAKTP